MERPKNLVCIGRTQAFQFCSAGFLFDIKMKLSFIGYLVLVGTAVYFILTIICEVF